MTTKICTDCRLDLDISNFYIHNKKKKDGTIKVTHQNLCKQCSSIRRKKYYVDNIDTEKALKKERANSIKEWFLDLKKTYKCSKCDDPRWYVIDFHHTDDNKEHNIGDLSCGKYSKKKILEELSKCIPLCSNCHRELHHLEKMQL